MRLGVKRKLTNQRDQLARKLANLRLFLRWRRAADTAPGSTTDECGLDLCDIFYINLDHRIDRRLHMEDEFQQIGVRSYSRFAAIPNHNGALGCSLSHLKLLDEWDASPSRMLMICEDDCTFLADRDRLDTLIGAFFKDSRFEVLCLAYNNANEYRVSDDFCITSDTQTMSCYVVKSSILSRLRQAGEMSVLGLKAGNSITVSAIDIVWKDLQRDHFFCFPVVRAAAQIESYSDIEGKIVNYGV